MTSPIPVEYIPLPGLGVAQVGAVVRPSTIAMVWRDPSLLRSGLAFSIPALFILLCHELGHYLLCRRFGIRATLPYFVPTPIGLGTFGAFIRIRSLIRTRQQLFDVGIGGPLAGFVALLPFLLYGIAHSQPAAIAASSVPTNLTLQQPGSSLAFTLVSRLFHGPLQPNEVLNLHPFALAAWVGLLATAINLLPLAQLDGGHILYAAVGERIQRMLRLPLWGALVGAGIFINPGWLLWALIIAMIGLRHPPLQDETTPLGAGRKWLAVLALVMLVLCFMPIPIDEIWLQQP